MSAPFAAKYPGYCSQCEEHFEPPTLIKSSSFGWVHDVCPDDVPSPAYSNKCCPTCTIELPLTGICDDCS